MPRRYRRGLKRNYRRKGRKLNKRQLRQVKRVVGNVQEHKKYYFSLPSSTVGTLGSPVPVDDGGLGPFNLSRMLQGDGSNTRDGDEIVLKSLKQRFWCGFQSGLTGGADNVVPYADLRVIFFQWKPNVAVTVSDILYTDPTAPGSIITWQSMLNYDNSQMYRIISDRTYKITGPGISFSTPQIFDMPTTIGSHHVVNGSLKLGQRISKKVRFLDGSLFHTNGIYVYMISSCPDTVVDLNKPSVYLNTELTFTDS